MRHLLTLLIGTLTVFILSPERSVGLPVTGLSLNESQNRSLQARGGQAIAGTVYDDSRKPIEGLWVELLDDAYGSIGRTRTDATGRYLFRGLSEGAYQVRVITNGVQAGETRRVEIAPDTAGAAQMVDFHLKPANEALPAPPAVSFVQDVPESARQAYEESTRLLPTNAGEALKKLQEAIALFPDYYAALTKYGFECLKSGQYDDAIAPLTKAVQVNPHGQDSRYALGVVQYNLKKLTESADTLTQMIDLAPESPNAPFARYYLGMALVKTGKPADAEPHLKKAYDQGRQSIPTDVHMALAQIYGNSKRYREAAKELELFLKETPDARDKDKIKNLISQLKAKAK